MKKRIVIIAVILLTVLAAGSALAADIPIDETHFPDQVFREYVLGSVDNGDKVLTEAECANVTSLYLEGKGITTLQGIEYFTALTYLDCDGNKLTSLDLSKNTALVILHCSGNDFVMLDLSKNTKMAGDIMTGGHYFPSAKAGYVDLSTLNGIDLSKVTTTPDNYYNTYSSTGRYSRKIFYDCGNSNVSAYFEISVTIEPVDIAGTDISLSFENTVYNGREQKPEVTASCSLYGSPVQLKQGSPQGDSVFYMSDYSVSYENNVGSGTATVTLTGNGITFSGSASRTFTIEKADISALTWDLNNTEHDLNAIKVRGIGTDQSYGYDNDGNWTQYYYTTLNKGTDYTVKYAADSATGLTTATVTGKGNFTGEITMDFVKISEANFPDEYFRAYVAEKFDTDADGYLSGYEIRKATEIGYSYRTNKLDSLKGIGFFTALTRLNVSGNFLEKLDLSRNTALTYLDCESNYLKTLDLSTNKKLQSVYCSNNAITTLKLPSAPELKTLNCANNRLKKLNLNTCPNLETVSCSGNKLTALTMTKCAKLITLYCGANALTGLDVTNAAALNKLDCSSNALTGLDLTKNTKLTYLACAENRLGSLNLSKNTKLQNLYCDHNRLTALNVTKNTKLTLLQCSYNPLVGLDLSKNKYLKSVDFYSGDKTCLTVKAEAGVFDLKTLTGLDLKKASKWTSESWNVTCKVKNGILTVNGPALIRYQYRCSSKITLSFLLMVDIKPAAVKSVTLPAASFPYAGIGIEPEPTVKAAVRGKTVTLTKDVDYTVTYKNNVKLGTAKVTVKGMNLYKGIVTKTFKIVKCPIDTLSPYLLYTTVPYTGSAVKPDVFVSNVEDSLTPGRDYTVKYTDNVNAGTGKVTIKGKGNYTGSVTLRFTVTPAGIADAYSHLEYDSVPYTGKALTPKVTVEFNGKTLKEGTDYTVAYKNNKKVGTAKVTITGKGNFTGTRTLTFDIVKK